ncbi:TolC family protein [bacterium]|nr:TolC family protein [bacterium]
MKFSRKHQSWVIAVLGLGLSYQINAETKQFRSTTDINEALKQLPGNALSLPFILDQAIRYSDSFQSIIGTLPASKAPELAALAPLDVLISAQFAYTNNDQEPSSSTSSTTVDKNKTYTLGLSKMFVTGTTLTASIEADDNNGTVTSTSSTTGVTSSAGFTTTESTVTLGLEQSLWKDFLGYSTRKKVRAGELEGSVVFDQVVEATEDWTLGIAQTYYQAWLNKQRTIAARAKLKRQEELSRITKLRVRRGSSARPELLQIESAAIAAKTEEARVSEELNQSWRLLIATVKLPRAWFKIDPVQIPMILEQQPKELDAFCSEATALLTAPTPDQEKIKSLVGENPKVERYRKSAEASELKLQAQRMDARPDLKVFGQYGANAYDDKLGSSLSEATGFDHDFWTVGIKLNMPLGFRANRAQVYQETANRLRSQAEASGAQTYQELDLLQACSDVTRLKADSIRLDSAVAKQKERSKLEQQRFATGRIPILNAIAASNDLSDTELLATQNKTLMHLSYWQLRKLKGELYAEMKKRIAEREQVY